jgi:hypothetical protein
MDVLNMKLKENTKMLKMGIKKARGEKGTMDARD